MRLLFVLPFVVCACTTRQSIGVPTGLSQADVPVSMRTNGKVDLLFMIDDSSSMDPMQLELRSHFGELITELSGIGGGAPIDLHVGVVTSNYGAGDVAEPGATATSGCQASPGGTRGDRKRSCRERV